MDYEKVHNLSLELGKKLIEKNPELREWVESKLPELRESEEERIRKKCMDFIRKWSSKEDRDECLAYLEKQKEQKPAERSEEDEKMIANLRSTLANIAVRGLIKKETEQKYSAWLKSIRPQLKQEWSEKDERIIEDAISALEEVGGYPRTLMGLKSLRPGQKDNKCISPKEGDIVVNKYGEISVFESWGHHPDGGSFNDKSYFFAKCILDGNYYNNYDCHPDSEGLRYATPEEIRKIVPYLLKEKV